jgi:hypothetical protein
VAGRAEKEHRQQDTNVRLLEFFHVADALKPRQGAASSLHLRRGKQANAKFTVCCASAGNGFKHRRAWTAERLFCSFSASASMTATRMLLLRTIRSVPFSNLTAIVTAVRRCIAACE